ncbi:hypothetical protein JB92DRAFT_3038122 [Gautieria morchelliformis]|nr:hypothetical protein JB92DRAFT_3038122 [Gautieria morchelliformis]
MMFTRHFSLQKSPDRLTSPAQKHHTFRNQIAKLKSSKSLFKMAKEIGSHVTDTHLMAALPRRGQASLYKLGTGNAMSAGPETEIGRSLDIKDFECS